MIGVLFLRVKVTIVCKQCGERFVLRGKRDRGRIETGFKQCLCNNKNHFDIEELRFNRHRKMALTAAN